MENAVVQTKKFEPNKQQTFDKKKHVEATILIRNKVYSIDQRKTVLSSGVMYKLTLLERISQLRPRRRKKPKLLNHDLDVVVVVVVVGVGVSGNIPTLLPVKELILFNFHLLNFTLTNTQGNCKSSENIFLKIVNNYKRN